LNMFLIVHFHFKIIKVFYNTMQSMQSGL